MKPEIIDTVNQKLKTADIIPAGYVGVNPMKNIWGKIDRSDLHSYIDGRWSKV